jgi:hypothetical protein
MQIKRQLTPIDPETSRMVTPDHYIAKIHRQLANSSFSDVKKKAKAIFRI